MHRLSRLTLPMGVKPNPQFASAKFDSTENATAQTQQAKTAQELLLQDPICGPVIKMAEQIAAQITVELAQVAPEYEMKFVRPVLPFDSDMPIKDGRYGHFTLRKKAGRQFGDNPLAIAGVKELLMRHDYGEWRMPITQPGAPTLFGFSIQF